MATSKGIDSFRDIRVATFSLREGLNADSVSSVQAARDGTVWIGNSGALNFFKDGKLSAIRTGQGLPGRDVTGLFEDHTGQLWVGVDRGLYVYDGRKFRLIDQGIVRAITEDTDGAIWAAYRDEFGSHCEPASSSAHQPAANPYGIQTGA